MSTRNILHFGLNRSGTNYLKELLDQHFDLEFMNIEGERSHPLHKHFRLYDDKSLIGRPNFRNDLKFTSFREYETYALGNPQHHDPPGSRGAGQKDPAGGDRNDHADAGQKYHADAIQNDHADAGQKDPAGGDRKDHADAGQKNHADAGQKNHAGSGSAEIANSGEETKNVVYVIISKDPYSWHLSYTRWGIKNKWSPSPHPYILEYNEFYRKWLEFSAETDRIAFVRYIDLLKAPDEIMKQLQYNFNLNRTREINPDVRIRKVPMSRRFSRKRLNYYLEETYLEGFSNEALIELNNHLDHEVAKQLGYTIRT